MTTEQDEFKGEMEELDRYFKTNDFSIGFLFIYTYMHIYKYIYINFC